jgi:hypothetical protein
MGQMLEHLKAVLHDTARSLALDVDDEPDPARIFLKLGIVETLFRRKSRDIHDVTLAKRKVMKVVQFTGSTLAGGRSGCARPPPFQ